MPGGARPPSGEQEFNHRQVIGVEGGVYMSAPVASAMRRGHCCKDPKSPARALIDKRAHPDYQEDLTGYFESATDGYPPQTFGLAFAMHQKFLETGDRRGVDWGIMSRISTLLRSARDFSHPRNSRDLSMIFLMAAQGGPTPFAPPSPPHAATEADLAVPTPFGTP
jgi:hypothetical protein